MDLVLEVNKLFVDIVHKERWKLGQVARRRAAVDVCVRMFSVKIALQIPGNEILYLTVTDGRYRLTGGKFPDRAEHN